jgi:hypothetical protein
MMLTRPIPILPQCWLSWIHALLSTIFVSTVFDSSIGSVFGTGDRAANRAKGRPTPGGQFGQPSRSPRVSDTPIGSWVQAVFCACEFFVAKSFFRRSSVNSLHIGAGDPRAECPRRDPARRRLRPAVGSPTGHAQGSRKTSARRLRQSDGRPCADSRGDQYPDGNQPGERRRAAAAGGKNDPPTGQCDRAGQKSLGTLTEHASKISDSAPLRLPVAMSNRRRLGVRSRQLNCRCLFPLEP